MRIMGVDPGLATVGIGIIDAVQMNAIQPIDWLVLRTKATKPLPERLTELYTDMQAILEEFSPERVVMERLFFETNTVSGIEVAEARGVLVLAVQQKGIPLLEPSPLQLKSAITGDGTADKRQMQDMVTRLLRLPAIPTPVDAADALGLAIFGTLSSVQTSTIMRQ